MTSTIIAVTTSNSEQRAQFRHTLFQALSSPTMLPYSTSALGMLISNATLSHATDGKVPSEVMEDLNKLPPADLHEDSENGWIDISPYGWPLVSFAKAYGSLPSGGNLKEDDPLHPWVVVFDAPKSHLIDGGFYLFCSTEPYLMRSGRWEIQNAQLIDTHHDFAIGDSSSSFKSVKYNEGYNAIEVEQVLEETRRLVRLTLNDLFLHRRRKSSVLSSINQMHSTFIDEFFQNLSPSSSPSTLPTTTPTPTAYKILWRAKYSKFISPLNDWTDPSPPSISLTGRTDHLKAEDLRGPLEEKLTRILPLSASRARLALSGCFCVRLGDKAQIKDLPLEKNDDEEIEQLASWVVLHPDLSLASLQTLPQYRGHNLATSSISQTAKTLTSAWCSKSFQRSFGITKNKNEDDIFKRLTIHADVAGDSEGRHFYGGKWKEVMAVEWIGIGEM